MTYLTDDFGDWLQLGVVRPIESGWTAFPTAGFSETSTLRVTYLIPPLPRAMSLRSFAWLRADYGLGGPAQVTQSIRLYPKPEKQLIVFPHPPDYLQRNLYRRFFEVRKSRRSYRLGLTPDVNWQIQLEELTKGPNP
ncbi:hypothetical protein [Leptolyngbya sp. FACHB-261]|uniref:hypothetical protein n=1 Tax=Leptolyngbya sp. FACHB-261 TaxID=2692806 RepID=UPI0016894919|nr:hypothetical protein [Leptolyngbya sp. FACHB-261]MBD2100263.1 hypothetical protein [Leptolyngbya sp. FACHB-261]